MSQVLPRRIPQLIPILTGLSKLWAIASPQPLPPATHVSSTLCFDRMSKLALVPVGLLPTPLRILFLLLFARVLRCLVNPVSPLLDHRVLFEVVPFLRPSFN